MPTAPGYAPAYRRPFAEELGRHRGGEFPPRTPAERIVLTIALLNRGLDLLEGLARRSLVGCKRGASRGRRP